MKKEVISKAILLVLLPAAALLTGALIVGRTQQHSARDQQDPPQDRVPRETTARGVPKEEVKKFHAQAVRMKEAEDEARALLQKKQYAAAETACRRALTVSPKIQGRTLNPTAWHLLGQIYMEQNRYREALPFLSEAAHNTRSDEVNLDTALCHFGMGDLKKARQLYSKLMMWQDSSIEPEYLPGISTTKTLETSILFSRGYYTYLRSQPEKALRNFTAATRLAPTNGMIAYFQGKCLKRLKRFPEALPCFTRAVAYGNSRIVRESTYQLSLWPDAERQKALAEAAKLKAAKS